MLAWNLNNVKLPRPLVYSRTNFMPLLFVRCEPTGSSPLFSCNKMLVFVQLEGRMEEGEVSQNTFHILIYNVSFFSLLSLLLLFNNLTMPTTFLTRQNKKKRLPQQQQSGCQQQHWHLHRVSWGCKSWLTQLWFYNWRRIRCKHLPVVRNLSPALIEIFTVTWPESQPCRPAKSSVGVGNLWVLERFGVSHFSLKFSFWWLLSLLNNFS